MLMEQVESEIFFGEDQIRETQHEFLKQGVLVFSDDLRAKVSQIKNLSVNSDDFDACD